MKKDFFVSIIMKNLSSNSKNSKQTNDKSIRHIKQREGMKLAQKIMHENANALKKLADK